jgi:hypothetical protein
MMQKALSQPRALQQRLGQEEEIRIREDLGF